MQDTYKLQKGFAKDAVPTRLTKDPVKGKRKVKVNATTWVYTSCDTDEEAIEKFNNLHQPEKLAKW